MTSGLCVNEAVLIVGFGFSLPRTSLCVTRLSLWGFFVWTLAVSQTGRGRKTKGLLHSLANCSYVYLAGGLTASDTAVHTSW